MLCSSRTCKRHTCLILGAGLLQMLGRACASPQLSSPASRAPDQRRLGPPTCLCMLPWQQHMQPNSRSSGCPQPQPACRALAYTQMNQKQQVAWTPVVAEVQVDAHAQQHTGHCLAAAPAPQTQRRTASTPGRALDHEPRVERQQARLEALCMLADACAQHTQLAQLRQLLGNAGRQNLPCKTCAAPQQAAHGDVSRCVGVRVGACSARPAAAAPQICTRERCLPGVHSNTAGSAHTRKVGNICRHACWGTHSLLIINNAGS